MKTFSAEAITNAYTDADQRVIAALSKIDMNAPLVKLRKKYAFGLDKLDDLHSSIELVAIGLMTARELNQEIRSLFPNHSKEVITTLNEEIFKPMLSYVQSLPSREELVSLGITENEPEEAKSEASTQEDSVDPLQSASIEVLEESLPTILQSESESPDAALARAGIEIEGDPTEKGESVAKNSPINLSESTRLPNISTRTGDSMATLTNNGIELDEVPKPPLKPEENQKQEPALTMIDTIPKKPEAPNLRQTKQDSEDPYQEPID